MSLISHAREVTISAGTTMFHTGDRADRFYLVLDGSIKLFQTSATGTEIVIRLVGHGESFGEHAMFDNGSFPVTAKALSDLRLLVIPEDAFFAALSRDTLLCRAILAGLSHRMRFLINQITMSKSLTSCDRLAQFILQHCDNNKGSEEFVLPFSKGDLASHLGMTQSTLSRTLTKLRNAGIIETSGRTLHVRNTKALAEHYNKKHSSSAQ